MTKVTSSFIENYDEMILSPLMRELYNGSAFYNVGYWEDLDINLKEACEALVKKHLNLIDLSKGAVRILDVGCGLGATTNAIKERFPKAKVTGINISQRQIEYARQQYPNCNFQVMDAAKLSFPNDYFDLIVSVEAIFHFHTRERFLKQAYRVLKKEGEFVFSDLLLYDSHWVGNWSVPKENLSLSLEAYQNLISKTPFRVESLQDITANSWMGFCNYIYNTKGMKALSKGLQESIIAYLIVNLSK